MRFFLARTENSKTVHLCEKHEFFFSTILKNGRDSFSLGILKNAQVASPTNALGGWYIYWQPAIVVFRAGLYQQPLLKFFPCHQLLVTTVNFFVVAGNGT